MAKIVVTRNGKPCAGVVVKVVSTFGFSQYNGSRTTDNKGVAEFSDNANRFRVYTDGQEVGLIDRLSGEHPFNIWRAPRTPGKRPAFLCLKQLQIA